MKIIEKNATVYKAVRKSGRRKLSWMGALHGIPGSWVVEYRKGKWARPAKEGTALFAWRKTPNPRWIKEGDELWIAKADIVDGVLLQGGKCPVTWLYWQPRSLAAFWRNPAAYLRSHDTDTASSIAGLWCSRIKLVERVA